MGQATNGVGVGHECVKSQDLTPLPLQELTPLPLALDKPLSKTHAITAVGNGSPRLGRGAPEQITSLMYKDAESMTDRNTAAEKKTSDQQPS